MTRKERDRLKYLDEGGKRTTANIREGRYTKESWQKAKKKEGWNQITGKEGGMQSRQHEKRKK